MVCASVGRDPPKGRDYVIGVDVAAGTGSSNSVLTVADTTSCEVVAEFADNLTSPEDLAEIAVALCRWFEGPRGPAFLIWEGNGPTGAIFGKSVVLKLGYRRVYFRRDEETVGRKKVSAKPGWWSGQKSKEAELGMYRRALEKGEFINRSRLSLEECLDYVRLGNGGVGPESAQQVEDRPSATGDEHGDRVISAMLCCKACGERNPVLHRRLRVPEHSMMGRHEAHKRKAEAQKGWLG